MATLDSNQIEDEFIEAKNNWELEKLYVDLASAKGKALTPVEKKFLRGLLCGCSPAEIAKIVYQSRSSSTVRVYLSNGVYKYIEEMLSAQSGYSVKVKNWSRVTYLLEKAGYKKGWLQIQPAITPVKNSKEKDTDSGITSVQIQDWGEAIDVSAFHGRTTELTTVQKWIVQERCRLVLLLGMGGIGKTAFSVKLADEIKDKFEYVIWRSLRLAPPLEMILNQLMEVLSLPETKSTETLDSRISQLIDCLRSSRCLIVLDHIDSILCNSYDNETREYPTVSADNSSIKNTFSLVPQIQYRQGYEGYGELIKRLGDSQHQSSLVLTSREKPPEFQAIEGEKLPVRSLKLTGLSQVENILILKAKGFTSLKEEECRVLNYWYAGNPLFLKLIATTIQELFGGNIYEFIQQGTVVFGEIRAILDQQFSRLSELEKQIMYWIALNQDLVSVRELQKEIISGFSKRLSQRLILEAMELLQKRCLIDKASLREAPPTPTLIEKAPTTLIEQEVSSFTQTPVLKEYIIEHLIEEDFKLSEDKESYLLMSNTIFAAQLKNHIQESYLNAET
ncbi:NB-ARC domain-containing protein [Nostoc sp. MG11]|uniref:NB-ARC domain-containing protein n=1 Tax=Nostoc sp. MG11 TaxID=2721166 RepID=UPI001868C5EA|nr:NB-ARC domain-containing protein [Nostoc sp. MG11]